jgi:hypothetical protein
MADLSTLIKVPISFLNFNLYAFNDVYIQQNGQPDQKIPTYLNVNVRGVYTGNIPTLTEKKILPDSIRIDQTSFLVIERSFVPLINVDASSTHPIDGSNFSFFLKPTLESDILLFILSILISQTLIIALVPLVKFIFLGDPYTSIFKDYKNRK